MIQFNEIKSEFQFHAGVKRLKNSDVLLYELKLSTSVPKLIWCACVIHFFLMQTGNISCDLLDLFFSNLPQMGERQMSLMKIHDGSKVFFLRRENISCIALIGRLGEVIYFH